MICGHCALSAHDDCNGFLRTSIEFCACAVRAHQPAPEPIRVHPCGRCGKPAQYLDRSFSGATCFICTHCEPRGYPTLVFPRFAPMAEAR